MLQLYKISVGMIMLCLISIGSCPTAEETLKVISLDVLSFIEILSVVSKG